jgi:DnaJ-class molecular chaperone
VAYAAATSPDAPSFASPSGRPERASADEDANGDVASAYAPLGVPAGATSGRLKDAYRERVKETHPDHGGDRESFQAVQQAYAVVSQSHDPDPASATGRGETTGPTTTATEAEIRS